MRSSSTARRKSRFCDGVSGVPGKLETQRGIDLFNRDRLAIHVRGDGFCRLDARHTRRVLTASGVSEEANEYQWRELDCASATPCGYEAKKSSMKDRDL